MLRRKLIFIALIPLVLFLGLFKLVNNDIWCIATRGGLFLQHGAAETLKAHGWLFDVLIYLLYETAGAVGIIISRCAVILAVTLLLIRYLSRKGIWSLPTGVLLLIFLCSSHWYIWESQELFSALFFLAVFLCTDLFVTSGRKSLFVISILLVLVWSNMSDLAILAPLLQFSFLLDSFVGRRLARAKDVWLPAVPPDKSVSNRATLAALCLLSAFASTVTLYGFDLPEIPAELRWTFSGVPLLWLLLFSTLLLASQFFTGFRPGQIFLFFCLVVFASHSALNFLLLSLAMPLFIYPLFRLKGEVVRRMKPEFVGACFVLLIVVLARYPFEIGLGISSFLPSRMAQFASQKNLQGNVLNSVEFGCCLNWMLSPRQNVLMKGDKETYGFMEAVRTAARESKAWAGLLQKHEVESAFLKYNDELEKVARIGTDGQMVMTEAPFSENHFPRSDWALVYWDDNGMILVRRNGMNRHILNEEYRFVFPEGESYQESLVRSGRLNRRDVLLELQRKLAEDKYCWRADRLLRAVRTVKMN